MKRRAIVAVCGLLCGCLPMATPPGRVDFGGLYDTGLGRARGKVSVGAHLAAFPARLPFDMGAGYVQAGFADEELAPPTAQRPAVVRQLARGLYVEARPVLAEGDIWRIFLGGRTELFFPSGNELIGHAVLARLSAELVAPVEFAPFATRARDGVYFGIAHGILAMGPYAEAGVTRWPTGERGATLSLGLSLTLPASVGVVCCFTDLKKKK